LLIPLTGGAYTARSLIANLQRCVNLFIEENPAEDEPPFPATHYLTPGLTLLGTAPLGTVVRGLYRTSTGVLYAVVGPIVYFIDSAFAFHQLGVIGSNTTPVSMSDNGIVVMLVDGSAQGHAITIIGNAFATISDPNFFGADRVEYIDTFFVLNRPNTTQWYISPSNWIPGVRFVALDVVAKSGGADPVVVVGVVRREIWPIGQLTSEVWFNSGAVDFPFQEMPGVFIEHGIAAKYSLVKADQSLFWISQDTQGQNVILQAEGFAVKRISTHSIEVSLAGYSTISDAIGFTYQQEGHIFYCLAFPSGDVTWCYDLSTGQWHERIFTDNNGVEHRHRANCMAFCYGVNVVGDWQTGQIYSMDLNNFTDNGQPIVRRRGFPHIISDGNRVLHTRFLADMETATDTGAVDGSSSIAPPQISLRWSDSKGRSWSNPVVRSLGALGDDLKSIQWRRLGLARDRVYELFWSDAAETALNGAFIETLDVGT
jgi:hypothetical protein